MDPNETPMANLAELLSDSSESSGDQAEGTVTDSSGELITLGEGMEHGMQF